MFCFTANLEAELSLESHKIHPANQKACKSDQFPKGRLEPIVRARTSGKITRSVEKRKKKKKKHRDLDFV